MPAQAAYQATVRVASTPTSITNQATTRSGNSYTITDTSKRVLDRNTPPTVKVAGTTAPATSYTVDYLFGIVTFNSAQTGAVTVSGKYMPTIEVLGANEYSVQLGADILDDTDFTNARTNGGYRTKVYGLQDASVTISKFDDRTGFFIEKIKSRSTCMIEILPASGTEAIRGWFAVESLNREGDVGSLEAGSLTLQLDGQLESSLSWRNV